jgi:6-phosphofructokinase 1
MRIGILTSGGDCPGLNAVIRAIVRKSILEKLETVGILNGWQGITEEKIIPLGINDVAGIINRGGTILGTSRYSPFEVEGGKEKLLKNAAKSKLDAIISIGGEGSMHIAKFAFEAGLNVIGLPKTIDNDIYGTDYCFGFDTASNIATEAIDRIHTTAESHHRVMVVEVMGRHAGWIAIRAGLAGGADMILIPEKPEKIDYVVDVVLKRKNRGKLFSIVVVAEGCDYLKNELSRYKELRESSKKLDDFGRERLGGIGHFLAEEIEDRTDIETRAVILGYVQRGGIPSAFDRLLGTRFGVHAVEMVKQKRWGRMAALKGLKIIDKSFDEVVGKIHLVDDEYYSVAKTFFN